MGLLLFLIMSSIATPPEPFTKRMRAGKPRTPEEGGQAETSRASEEREAATKAKAHGGAISGGSSQDWMQQVRSKAKQAAHAARRDPAGAAVATAAAEALSHGAQPHEVAQIVAQAILDVHSGDIGATDVAMVQCARDKQSRQVFKVFCQPWNEPCPMIPTWERHFELLERIWRVLPSSTPDIKPSLGGLELWFNASQRPKDQHQCLLVDEAKVDQGVGRGMCLIDGYLRISLGKNVEHQMVHEHGHRLVCYACHGPPPSFSESDEEGIVKKVDYHVCHHTCHMKSCMNPFHMQWMPLSKHTSYHTRKPEHHKSRGKGGKFVNNKKKFVKVKKAP